MVEKPLGYFILLIFSLGSVVDRFGTLVIQWDAIRRSGVTPCHPMGRYEEVGDHPLSSSGALRGGWGSRDAERRSGAKGR